MRKNRAFSHKKGNKYKESFSTEFAWPLYA